MQYVSVNVCNHDNPNQRPCVNCEVYNEVGESVVFREEILLSI